MSKTLVKKAGVAAAEQALRSMMPELQQFLQNIDDRIVRLETKMEHRFAQMDQRFDELKREVDVKFEQTRDLINELGLKINTVGTRLEAYTDFTKTNSVKLDVWLERLVKVEMNQAVRRRRAS